MVTGFAWYRREQWLRLRELASDCDKLDDSYDEWLAGAQKALLEMTRLAFPSGGSMSTSMLPPVENTALGLTPSAPPGPRLWPRRFGGHIKVG